jgi:hypothetical protein
MNKPKQDFETAVPALDTRAEIEVAVEQEEERQTILHCRLRSAVFSMIRIHPTTFLIEQDGTKRKLVSALDIAVAPEWGPGNFSGGHLHFTLVFEGLGKECRSFYMEEFAAPGENLLFKTDAIRRNRTDVYRVMIKDV